MQEINNMNNVNSPKEAISLDNSMTSIKKANGKKTILPKINERLSKMGSQKALESTL